MSAYPWDSESKGAHAQEPGAAEMLSRPAGEGYSLAEPAWEEGLLCDPITPSPESSRGDLCEDPHCFSFLQPRSPQPSLNLGGPLLWKHLSNRKNPSAMKEPRTQPLQPAERGSSGRPLRGEGQYEGTVLPCHGHG